MRIVTADRVLLTAATNIQLLLFLMLHQQSNWIRAEVAAAEHAEPADAGNDWGEHGQERRRIETLTTMREQALLQSSTVDHSSLQPEASDSTDAMQVADASPIDDNNHIDGTELSGTEGTQQRTSAFMEKEMEEIQHQEESSPVLGQESAQPKMTASAEQQQKTMEPSGQDQHQQQESPPQQQHEEQHPHPKRNYASKECGAKVLYANEEAENKAAILNDPERDDYMRNPCERAQNKFLIIELCETIQPTSLDIANFELFSSNPKNFRLWGSERYPTQDWAKIGDFEAQDSREIQTFHVAHEHASYAKFVKLELLTHHGKEHFCTLSTFRLYGTSMVDEYEAEASSSSSSSNGHSHQQIHAAIEPQPVLVGEGGIAIGGETATGFPPTDGFQQQRLRPAGTTQSDDGGGEEDPLYEDFENNTAGDSTIDECNINDQQQSMEDTLFVTSTTKTTADSHIKNEVVDEPRERSPIASNDTKSAEEDGPSRMEEKRAEERGAAPASDNMLKTIVSNLKQVFDTFSSKKDGEKDVNDSQAGPAENEQQKRQRRLASSRPSSSLQIWRRSLLRQNPSAFCRLCPRNPGMRQCHLFCRTFFPQDGQLASAAIRKMAAQKRAEKARLEFLDKVLRRQTAAFCPLPPKPLTCLRKSEATAPTQNAQQQKASANQLQQRQTAGNGIGGQQQATATLNGEGGATTNGATNGAAKQQQQQMPQKPIILNSKIVDKANLRPLPGTSTNHKESVFMKLNKRLTALEQNMSSSSEHLLELSRKCNIADGQSKAEEEKKQQERMARTAERVAKQETQRMEQEMKQKISELQRDVRRLSQQLQAVTTAIQSGNGGFFYRPFLTPIHGYAASDGPPCTEQGCINRGELMSTVSPLHSTSSAAYESMPIATSSPSASTTMVEAANPGKEGLWTTTQVVYLMVIVHVCTFLAWKLVNSLWNRLLCPSSISHHQHHHQQQISPMSPMSMTRTPLTSRQTHHHPHMSPQSPPPSHLIVNLNSHPAQCATSPNSS